MSSPSHELFSKHVWDTGGFYRFVVFWLLFVLPPFHVTEGLAQHNGGWATLADVTYRTVADPQSGYDMDVPEFGQKVLALQGQKVRLKGFMVPLDYLLKKQYFVLSSMPFNLCFFCGGAGPETVVEVFSKEPISLTEDMVWVEGVLKVNTVNDPEKLMYQIVAAEVIPAN